MSIYETACKYLLTSAQINRIHGFWSTGNNTDPYHGLTLVQQIRSQSLNKQQSNHYFNHSQVDSFSRVVDNDCETTVQDCISSCYVPSFKRIITSLTLNSSSVAGLVPAVSEFQKCSCPRQSIPKPSLQFEHSDNCYDSSCAQYNDRHGNGRRQDLSNCRKSKQNSPQFSRIKANPQDRRAQKRGQNRKAAHNYRKKKLGEKNKLLEEEMKLVYSKVCLEGMVENLDKSIMDFLELNVIRVKNDENSVFFGCPICSKLKVGMRNLRHHLTTNHMEYNRNQ